MLVDQFGKPMSVEKAQLAETIDIHGISGYKPTLSRQARGLNIYNITELQGITAINKHGETSTGTTERPLFLLSIDDRIEMFKRTTMLQGVITGRAKRIAGLNWKVIRKTKDDDRILAFLKEYKELYDELEGTTDIKMLATKFMMKKKLKERMPELMDDMSNFKPALRRLKRKMNRRDEDTSTEIEEWMKTPNIHDTFATLIHRWIVDLMIHGSVGLYKEYDIQKKLSNFYVLPGGTVFPYRSPTVGGVSAYFQIIPTFEPKIYYDDEIAFSSYIPTSWSSYGEVPVEALINKVAETLMFDRRSADQADGTVPPEKLIIFGQNPSPFGGLTQTGEFELPMEKAEQKRIETKLNTARKEAIATLSGVGKPVVMDISKADTYSAQSDRQDKLLRDMALIYNMSNMEVNLAGGDFTSGKETSDSQKEIDQEKGVGPILKSIEELINRQILPFRFGYDFEFKFDVEPSEQEQVELEEKKMRTKTYAVNEIRESRGDDVFPDEKYDIPEEGVQQPPDGSEMDPLNMRSM